jgi:TonB-dependent SusC/RagA subfamily outer membrane receptor
MIRLFRSHTATRLNDVSLLLTEEESAPFSFFKWLFWRKDIDPDTDSGKRMLQHELTHINEKHSADKLFTELLLVIFWMNPLFWVIRRELYAIHEFLADQKAITGKDGAAFASMILLASHGTVAPTLSNPFFTSQLKRRLIMITTSKSNSYSYLRRISGLVLMLLTTTLLVLNIEQAQAQKTIPPPPPPAAPADGQWKELPDSIKSAEVIDRKGVCYIKYEMKDGRKLVYELNQARKKNYFIPPPPPPAPAPPPAPVKASGTPTPVAAPAVPADPAQPQATSTPAPKATPAIPPPPPPAKGQNILFETNGDKPLYIYSASQISEAQMHQLDPATIESINVLKGDEAIKTYGQPGKNGVVIITPKTQKQNPDKSGNEQTVNIKTGQDTIVTNVNTNLVNTVNINAGNNINPLYVINKQIVSVVSVNILLVDAIVSINVLKDQAAIKQYGKEGKNGVVEITTKKKVTDNH